MNPTKFAELIWWDTTSNTNSKDSCDLEKYFTNLIQTTIPLFFTDFLQWGNDALWKANKYKKTKEGMTNADVQTSVVTEEEILLHQILKQFPKLQAHITEKEVLMREGKQSVWDSFYFES